MLLKVQLLFMGGYKFRLYYFIIWVRVIFLKKRVFIGLLLFVTFCNGGSAKSIQIHRNIRGMKLLTNFSFSGITQMIRNFIYPSKIDLQIESVIIRRICKLEMDKIASKFFRRLSLLKYVTYKICNY